ncbi:MAG: class I SAM-dependent methyltransferase [Crocinitomicaceae bacterium]|jgi:SAM-dependent methyltransferase|nr:class I SAM-dependent methyltransferase [Crocinitomicaceae bacterium]MDP4723317.1 class I SAM-dependent methyltransferase [Crocinitomicaceae bacterium]MDP4739928.1 class I SAM-dependent methyltransferase [Crocinitomicaceae bacterium]MDP4800203.1 class I SAM-dependent methyltransferase [Crocinitomicaceae bacterium]MDP4868131.1 class I SAM-dependent methyltransferase [Crocinitomicaceae bacterium]
MKAFWNERYAETDYAYGQEANDFLKAQEIGSSLKVLCLAEGEGRNGVYLAKLGHEVTCVDYAESGLQKTQQLAAQHEVEVACVCADLGEMQLQANTWDVIVAIFAHFPKPVKNHIWPQIFTALKPGGKLIMEVYDQEQLRFGTGGPQHAELLYSQEELHDLLVGDFKSMQIEKVYREVHEGAYHNGAAATLQVLAVK